MSGKWITSKQVGIYMKARKNGKTQQVAAAQAYTIRHKSKIVRIGAEYFSTALIGTKRAIRNNFYSHNTRASWGLEKRN